MNGDVQVTRRRTPQTSLTLTGQSDPLAILHPRRNPHVDGSVAGRDAGAATLIARILDQRTATPAVGARFGEAERTLVAVDHA